MTLKQYNMILESNVFTLKQYYMILKKNAKILFSILLKEFSWQMTYNKILVK